MRVGYFWWNVDESGHYQLLLTKVYPLKDMSEMASSSHFVIWWKAFTANIVKGEYNDFPRGRVEFDVGYERQIVYHGCIGGIPEQLKILLTNEFNVGQDAVWKFNSHYDMENPSDRLDNEEDNPWETI
jgi:hypothetical protein